MTKVDDIKVVLSMNKKQAYIVQEALDLFARLLCGQVKELELFFRQQIAMRMKKDVDFDVLLESVAKIKKAVFPELAYNEFYGIFGENTHPKSKVAFDIIQCLRHELWKYQYSIDSSIGAHTVDADTPFKTSEEPLPKVMVE